MEALNHYGMEAILKGLILLAEQHKEKREQTERELKTCQTAGEADFLSNVIDEERNLESWAKQVSHELTAAMLTNHRTKFNFYLVFTEWEALDLPEEMED